jgi:hypothetical protein
VSSLLHRGPHPVIGELFPFMPGDWFEAFDVETVHGLALVRDRRLDLLSIVARNPGQGDGGRFLAACMAAYDVVGVWELLNPELEAMLERRGFWHAADVFQGEAVAGMIWRKAAA